MYRKSINTGIYSNWFSYTLNSLKRGTLKVLINRAYTLCSADYYRKEELLYLEKVFVERNNNPQQLVKKKKKIMKKVLDD